jgi:hypothetical protein
MPQTIEFEGVEHEFPDDFSQADISSALKSHKPPQPEVVAVSPQDDPEPVYGDDEDAIQEAITNENRASPWERINEPNIKLPRFEQQEGALKQVGAGVANAGAGLVESLTSGLGMSSLALPLAGAAVTKLAAAAFGTHMVKSGTEGVINAETLQEGTEAVAGTALGALALIPLPQFRGTKRRRRPYRERRRMRVGGRPQFPSISAPIRMLPASWQARKVERRCGRARWLKAARYSGRARAKRCNRRARLRRATPSSSAFRARLSDYRVDC